MAKKPHLSHWSPLASQSWSSGSFYLKAGICSQFSTGCSHLSRSYSWPIPFDTTHCLPAPEQTDRSPLRVAVRLRWEAFSVWGCRGAGTRLWTQDSGRPGPGPVSQRYFCGGQQLTSDDSWGFGAFSFSFLLLGISCLMRLVPDTFVLFSFSCELFSCFRGLIGGRGLSSSPLINLSYGRINLEGYQKRWSIMGGNSRNIEAIGV